jgi:hypothetical protein
MKYLALAALVAFLAVPLAMGCSEKPAPTPVKTPSVTDTAKAAATVSAAAVKGAATATEAAVKAAVTATEKKDK